MVDAVIFRFLGVVPTSKSRRTALIHAFYIVLWIECTRLIFIYFPFALSREKKERIKMGFGIFKFGSNAPAIVNQPVSSTAGSDPSTIGPVQPVMEPYQEVPLTVFGTSEVEDLPQDDINQNEEPTLGPLSDSEAWVIIDEKSKWVHSEYSSSGDVRLE